MSDTYEFPDREDLPQIVAKKDDYELPETKTIFMRYLEDEWEDEEIVGVMETINGLFGPDVQIALLTDSIEMMGQDDVREMLESLLDEAE